MIFVSFAFKNIAPNLTSAADASTKFIIVEMVKMSPLIRMG